MRYPDGLRSMIVAESDGTATGILCLNKIVDVISLNEYFELRPYQHLQKHHLSNGQNEMHVNSDVIFHNDDAAARLEENDHLLVSPLSLSAFTTSIHKTHSTRRHCSIKDTKRNDA